jgi:hypothetical protein
VKGNKMKSRILGALIATMLCIVGINLAAYSATGDGFLLGKKNKADKVTKLIKKGDGSALSLKTDSSSPPLKVTSDEKVTNFNADLIDGLDSTDLKSQGYRYTLPDISGVESFTVSFPSLPSGIYDAQYSVVAAMGSVGEQIRCGFENGSTRVEALSYGSTYSSFSTSNGGTILDSRKTSPVLYCFASATIETDPDSGSLSSVALIRIDSFSSKTATRAPNQAPVSRRKANSSTD